MHIIIEEIEKIRASNNIKIIEENLIRKINKISFFYDRVEFVTNSTLTLKFLCISVLEICFYPLTLRIFSSFKDISKI